MHFNRRNRVGNSILRAMLLCVLIARSCFLLSADTEDIARSIEGEAMGFLCISSVNSNTCTEVLWAVPEDTAQLVYDTIRPQWNPIDSIRIALRTKPFITGALDGRNSFVSADPVSIFGLRYGYDWGKVAAHTGIYGSKYIEFTGNDSMLYRFRYISSTFEYKLYRSYRYSFLCFGQVGVGGTSVKSKINPIGSPDIKPMIPLELGMYGSVRMLRYFGLAAGLGTRLALLKGGNRFSGPIYTFGITYFPSAMLEDGKKVLEKLNLKVPVALE